MKKAELLKTLADAFNSSGADAKFGVSDHELAAIALRYLERSFGKDETTSQDKSNCLKADREDAGRQADSQSITTPSGTVDPILETLVQKRSQQYASFQSANADVHQRAAYLTEVYRVKQARKDLDGVLQNVTHLDDFGSSPELASVVHYITNAIMWLGLELKRLGEANPYPNSRNPASPVVDKTADNLKF